MPDFFDRYIHLACEKTVTEALQESATIFHEIRDHLEELANTVYAADKWPAREIVQHCIDTERILSYRALRFARNDETPLAGFDEALFAKHTTATSRTIHDLLEEFAMVRQSTIVLFKNFSTDMLVRKGICFNREVSVLALGFIMAGHPIHHRNILKQRYFPLIGRA